MSQKIFGISEYFEKSKFEFLEVLLYFQMHSRTLLPWKQTLISDQPAPKSDLDPYSLVFAI